MMLRRTCSSIRAKDRAQKLRFDQREITMELIRLTSKIQRCRRNRKRQHGFEHFFLCSIEWLEGRGGATTRRRSARIHATDEARPHEAHDVHLGEDLVAKKIRIRWGMGEVEEARVVVGAGWRGESARHGHGKDGCARCI